jgi:Zn-dependent alcohol dehydrogenase
LKLRAAVVWEKSVEELEMEEPRADEVRVRDSEQGQAFKPVLMMAG